jgi:hypothetical protein
VAYAPFNGILEMMIVRVIERESSRERHGFVLIVKSASIQVDWDVPPDH